MKNITLLLSLTILSFFAQAQTTLPLDPETKKVQYQGVAPEDSLSQQEIYKRAWAFLQKKFPEQKFTLNDETNFKIGKKGSVIAITTYDYKYQMNNVVEFKILLEARDARYKYTLSDFNTYKQKNGPNSSQTLEFTLEKASTANKKEFNQQIDTKVNDLLKELKDYIKRGEQSNKDNW